jgi:hypothetical protein
VLWWELDGEPCETIEAEMKESTLWFAPIGEANLRRDRNGKFEWGVARANALAAAWIKKGAPKVIGNASPNKKKSSRETSTRH